VTLATARFSSFWVIASSFEISGNKSDRPEHRGGRG
jgi:hypothetical protein